MLYIAPHERFIQGDLMTNKESIGVIIAPNSAAGAVPMYRTESGASAFEIDEPYLLSDGVSLQSPVPVYDAGAPVGVDALGRPVDALPVNLPAPAVVAWTPFTLTAGDSGDWLGYSNGDIAYPPFNPPVGSISAEPCSVSELEAFYLEDGGTPVAIFQGDIRSEVQSLTVTIDGVSGAENSVTLFGGNTVIAFNMSADFVQFGNYEVSFTPA